MNVKMENGVPVLELDGRITSANAAEVETQAGEFLADKPGKAPLWQVKAQRVIQRGTLGAFPLRADRERGLIVVVPHLGDDDFPQRAGGLVFVFKHRVPFLECRRCRL